MTARRTLQSLASASLTALAMTVSAFAQGISPVNPVNPSGVRLFPNAVTSADNIAAQAATFMHGGMMAWDSGGSNWDRLLLTSGALHVNVQNASLAVTQSGTWNIGSITTLPALPTGANTIGGVNLAQYTPVSGRLPVDGSGVTQPVSGTVTANVGTFPDNEPFNVAQMNGVAVTMGDGVSGTGVQRVTIASDSAGQVTESSSTALLAGQQAVTGTAAALATNTTKEVCVKALLANTINVYVGPTGVTTSTGLELGPGDSYCTRVTNTNALFVIASGAGPSVSWAARN